MVGKRREEREEERAHALAQEQAREATRATQTDDASVDPDESLESEEEPMRAAEDPGDPGAGPHPSKG